MEPETLPRIVGKATFKWNSAHEGQRVVRKEGIECSRKPIGCTLDHRRGSEVERETGVNAPSAKHRVEFIYRVGMKRL
jgi:hypothetical protein